MTKMTQCTLFSIALLFSQLALAGKPESVQYIFPLDKSELISRTCEIIVRPGSPIDEATIQPDLISVRGSGNRDYAGKIILTADKKTLLFKPNDAYQPSEVITVHVGNGLKTRDDNAVPAFSFHFTVTPLEQPISPAKYRKELNLIPTEDAFPPVSAAASISDSLPPDFPTFTVTVSGQPAEGDFFLSPTFFVNGEGYNIIVSNTGEVKYYQKITDGVPVDFKVLPNGKLSYGVMSALNETRLGGYTDFYMMDSTYSIIDHYQMGNGYTADYHEFTYLSNGHALMLAYDLQPIDLSQVVPGGHPAALVSGAIIQELDQDKNVIFQWRSWDHYKLTDSYADLTQSIFDAIHTNSIDLDRDSNLLISTYGLAELTKVNRQTGDIIWRMGGKNNQFTFLNESQEHAPLYFMRQHDIRRAPNGNITIFDDGDRDLRGYSRVVEYAVDERQMTATKVWEFRKSPDVFSPNMGSAQRLANGNTVIGWGLASSYGLPAVTEVDPAGNIVFELKFDLPILLSYRAMKFAWDGGKPAANVMVSEVLAGNTYSFDKGDQRTGLSIKFNQIGGFGYNEAVAKKYNYAPLVPQFIGRAPIVKPVRAVLSQFNIGNVNAEISFDADFYGIENPDSILIFHREFEGRGLFIALPTVYNAARNTVVATMTKFGEFVLGYPDYQSQVFPPLPISPIGGQAVDQSKPVRLEWTPVGYIGEYTLQVARDAEFNNIVANEEYITDAIYNLQTPDPNTTYYWRVKSFNEIGESSWSETSVFETKAPYVRLIAPNGGERWQRGLDYFLQWEDILAEDVILELYQNNSLRLVIDTTFSTGAYKWEIPVFVDSAADYKIRIRSLDRPEINDLSDSDFLISSSPTAVDNPMVPDEMNFALAQNYPNPFNPSTTISYQVPARSHVQLKVYDVRGSEIAVLVDEIQNPDQYHITFDGGGLPAGIYFYKLQVAGNYSETKKMLLVK